MGHWSSPDNQATGTPRHHRGGAGGGNPKHHDFVFHSPIKERLPVTRLQFEEFEFIHKDAAEQHKRGVEDEANAEWGFWRKEYQKRTEVEGKVTRGKVPVFFLRDAEGKLRSFGLAMMFRLAYAHSVGESMRRAQEKSVAAELDFAECLFGHVPSRGQDNDKQGLRGRVSVGLASLVSQVQPTAPVELVLGNPKASFYPSYVEQVPGRPGSRPPGAWKTWMDKDAIPRGWKRYRPTTGPVRAILPTTAAGTVNAKVVTKFAPLPKGARFKAALRVHNLRKEELGALLWALDFGGAEGARHTLGLARSHGFGAVQIKVVGQRLLENRTWRPPEGDYLSECRAAFIHWMGTQVPGWAGTIQILELIALAMPISPDDARHMSIAHPENGNEFQQAKMDKNKMVLPSATAGTR